MKNGLDILGEPSLVVHQGFRDVVGFMAYLLSLSEDTEQGYGLCPCTFWEATWKCCQNGPAMTRSLDSSPVDLHS